MRPKFIRIQGNIINVNNISDVALLDRGGSKDTKVTYLNQDHLWFSGDVRDEIWELMKLALKPKDEDLQKKNTIPPEEMEEFGNGTVISAKIIEEIKAEKDKEEEKLRVVGIKDDGVLMFSDPKDIGHIRFSDQVKITDSIKVIGVYEDDGSPVYSNDHVHASDFIERDGNGIPVYRRP
jgi:hypothetical protein